MNGHEPASALAAVEDTAARLWAGIAQGAATVTVRCGEIEIRLESAGVAAVTTTSIVADVVAADVMARPGDGNGMAPLAGASAEAIAVPASDAWHVCAPLVGVFYRAPSPAEPPFVEVGDHIRMGQQIGIIEAMKMMVPVESEVAGRVTAILADNAEPVEFGARLLAVASD